LKKKILVTGGAGCIGFEVVKQLLKKKYEVVVFDLYEQIVKVESVLKKYKNCKTYIGTIMDVNALTEASKDCSCIIHLAAYLGVNRTETNSLMCLDLNINGTKNVLDAATANRKLIKIIFASSSEVYGDPLKNPINEKAITQGKTVYAVSKLAGEELVKAYSKKFPKINYTILRYFNTYGPNQIAQFVIPKFLNNISQGKSPIVYGDGNQIRSYCYVEDTAAATIKCLVSKKTNGKIINIGNSNEPISLKKLSLLCIKLFAKNKKMKVKLLNSFIKSDRSKSREIQQRYCDTTYAKKIISFDAKVKLETGLKKLYLYGKFNDTWSLNNEKYLID
tara:strand:+ start:1885 stop:2886 length:1002 start_codon:yes stop_codon:yes gene_type:complete